MTQFRNGDVVRLERGILTAHKGDRAFVYEEYQDFDDQTKKGVRLITEYGVNLGGLSFNDQQLYLTFIEHSGMTYTFTDVLKLKNDFDNGVLSVVFV